MSIINSPLPLFLSFFFEIFSSFLKLNVMGSYCDNIERRRFVLELNYLELFRTHEITHFSDHTTTDDAIGTATATLLVINQDIKI